LIFLLFGPPGCGKGTQSQAISQWLSIPSISTGDMLRAEYAAGTELGKAAHAVTAGGCLAADNAVNEMMARRLSRADCAQSFLLDGYPRTLPQAGFFDDFLSRRGAPPITILHLNVPDEILARRISARRICPVCKRVYSLIHRPPTRAGICDADHAPLVQRVDDGREAIDQRLAGYVRQTDPVLQHYASSRYYRIEGNRPPDEVAAEIRDVLKESLAGVYAHRARA
jgi:adenylate kinase